MKIRYIRNLTLSTCCLVLLSGCVITPGSYPVQYGADTQGWGGYQPETYIWDGFEYIGIVGDQYVYLAPGNVWMIAEPYRMSRINRYRDSHPDWREHSTRNTHFRDEHIGSDHFEHTIQDRRNEVVRPVIQDRRNEFARPVIQDRHNEVARPVIQDKRNQPAIQDRPGRHGFQNRRNDASQSDNQTRHTDRNDSGDQGRHNEVNRPDIPK
jgi:hypothetical protein